MPFFLKRVIYIDGPEGRQIKQNIFALYIHMASFAVQIMRYFPC